MRPPILFGLTLVLASEAISDDKPIPQDLPKMEKRSRERYEWNLQTNLGAYEKIGKKNPKWDAPARETMELASRLASPPVDSKVTLEKVNKSAKAAIDAGCDDPMILHFFNRSATGSNAQSPEEAIRRTRISAKAVAASPYPAFRRATALERDGTLALTGDVVGTGPRKEAIRQFDAALALLPESFDHDDRNPFWEERWFDTVMACIWGYRKAGIDLPECLERAEAVIAKIPELKVLQLQVRGTYWFLLGWEARTKAFVPNVPEGGMEMLQKCLVQSKKAFEEAWAIRLGDARTALRLMEIDKSVGGDRATMELWFERAMKADGDNVAACFTKLDWLDPKWHGTPEEMLAFGRQCRDTKNWRTGISLLVGDAYYRFAIMLPQPAMLAYWKKPEVWSDIKSGYDEYLQHYPDDDAARSKYAFFCYYSTHFPEADDQFQILGDRLRTWPHFPFVPLEGLKRARADVDRRLNDPSPNRR